MKKSSYRLVGKIVLIILVLALGLLLGWYGRLYYASTLPSKLIEVRANSPEYHFINPLLFVDSSREAPEYNSLQSLLNDFVSTSKKNGDVSSLSVYFRDLNSGKWTGVNQDTLYAPSSMLKVAVMIGYLKQSENDSSVLLKKIPYTSAVDPGQNYKPEHSLASGDYPARDLIEAMIIDSDNSALLSLYDNNRQGFIDVLKSLNITPPPSIDTTDFMSPRTYSSLFRILFSATYLSPDVSEQTLQLLSLTNWKKGLVAGVPDTVAVSHKFGEHTSILVDGQVQSRELHDCGIIYYPQHPYFLCVMTRGQDFTKLESVISNISRLTYDNVPSK